jgi:hypothetical protein
LIPERRSLQSKAAVLSTGEEKLALFTVEPNDDMQRCRVLINMPRTLCTAHPDSSQVLAISMQLQPLLFAGHSRGSDDAMSNG